MLKDLQFGQGPSGDDLILQPNVITNYLYGYELRLGIRGAVCNLHQAEFLFLMSDILGHDSYLLMGYTVHEARLTYHLGL
jgi:hypothetical protein